MRALIAALCFAGLLVAGGAAAQSMRPNSQGIASSLVCLISGGAGCVMTGTLTLPTKTCNTLELVLGGATTGICDNGGGTRIVLVSNGTPEAEFSSSVNSTIYTPLTSTSTATLKKNLLSATSTTIDATTGTCTTVTVAGTVLDFTITATCTAAQTVIVTFSDGFGASPNCTISSANSAAGAVTTGTPYQSAGATTSATFTFPAVTAGKYNAHCML